MNPVTIAVFALLGFLAGMVSAAVQEVAMEDAVVKSGVMVHRGVTYRVTRND